MLIIGNYEVKETDVLLKLKVKVVVDLTHPDIVKTQKEFLEQRAPFNVNDQVTSAIESAISDFPWARFASVE